MEDTKKKTDFTIIQYHHTKVFLPAELVVHDTKVAQKKSLAQSKEAMDRQKRVNEAKDALKLEDCSGLDTSLLDVEKQREILQEIFQTNKLQKEKRVEVAVQSKRVEEAVQQEQKRLLEETTQKERAQTEAAQQRRYQAAQPTSNNTVYVPDNVGSK